LIKGKKMTDTETTTYLLDNEEINMEEIIGLDPDNSSDFPPLLDEDQEEELNSKISQHGFALNPLTKLVVVGVGMLSVVGIFALIWSLMSGSSNYTAKLVSSEAIEEIEESDIDIDPEKAQLKAELALREQKEQMEKLKVPPPKTQPKPQPKPQKVVQNQAKPAPPPPQPTRAKLLPPPTPEPESEPEIDPFALWQELSLAGSYGGALAKINNNLPSSQELSFGEAPDSDSSSIASSRDSLSSTPLGKKISQVKLNQVVHGNLSTPIIWHSDDAAELPPAMITLSEAIIDGQGKELFPADSILIAEVTPYNQNGGLIEIDVREVRLPDGSSQSIPPGSIAVNRDNGKPLIAQLQREGGENGGIKIDPNTILNTASILSDLADFRGTRSLHLFGRRGTSSPRRTGETITSFWYLPENIKVSLRIIKSFSVEAEIEPLELDLEAIDLTQVSSEFGEFAVRTANTLPMVVNGVRKDRFVHFKF
jgi:hypothetical protein